MIFAVLLCLTGASALAAAWLKSRETHRDETRMAGYIASLKAVAAEQRTRVAELEQALTRRDQRLAAQERLLDGQAAHLRTLDAHYVG